jgi:glutaredoxin 3
MGVELVVEEIEFGLVHGEVGGWSMWLSYRLRRISKILPLASMLRRRRPVHTAVINQEDIMTQVTIYTSPVCGYCTMAKRLLAGKGVAVHEIDAASDPHTLQEMMTRSGRRTFPQIFFGERHIGGYDDLVALDRSGGFDAALAAA